MPLERHAATAAAALLLAAVLGAPPAPAADEPRRFTMSPAEGGFVRLDTVTGEVAFCTRAGTDWSCRPMADQGRDVRQENDRLAAENRRLEKEVRRLEDALGLGESKPGEERKAERPGGRLELPSEADIDRAFTYFERMIRKFRDKLKELDGPERKGTAL